MFIELLGAPGTGKTTLKPIVIQFLRERGLKVYTIDDAIPVFAKRTLWGKIASSLIPPSWWKATSWRVYSRIRLWYRARFAYENRVFWRFVAELQRNRPISREHQRLIRRYFDDIMAYYHFTKTYKQPFEILVLDEGFTHRVTHIVSELESPDLNHIIQYLKFMPKPNIFIFVRASIDTCVERVRTRGLRGRLTSKGKQDVTQFIMNAEHALDISIRYLKSTGERIIEVNNDGILDECVVSLISELDNAIRNKVPDCGSNL